MAKELTAKEHKARDKILTKAAIAIDKLGGGKNRIKEKRD